MRFSFLLCFVLLCWPSSGEAQRILHRIRFGESLTSIARHYYGSEEHAVVLAMANSLDPGRELKAGEHIRIPTAWYYTSRKAQSIENLAKDLLGDRRRSQALLLFNELGRKKRAKKNQRILVPFSLVHVVSASDTFPDLAQKYYRTPKYGGLLASYNFIKAAKPSPGAELLIPIWEVRITERRLEELVHERLLGIDQGHEQEDRAALQEANALLRGGEYGAVALRLIQLLARNSSSDTYLAEVYKLLAVAYVALDRSDLAVKSFQEALLHQPSMALDPVTTSPKVIRAFVDAKSQLRGGGS